MTPARRSLWARTSGALTLTSRRCVRWSRRWPCCIPLSRACCALSSATSWCLFSASLSRRPSRGRSGSSTLALRRTNNLALKTPTRPQLRMPTLWWTALKPRQAADQTKVQLQLPRRRRAPPTRARKTSRSQAPVVAGRARASCAFSPATLTWLATRSSRSAPTLPWHGRSPFLCQACTWSCLSRAMTTSSRRTQVIKQSHRTFQRKDRIAFNSSRDSEHRLDLLERVPCAAHNMVVQVERQSARSSFRRVGRERQVRGHSLVRQ
mmetsp:Transcript_18404/g.52848  ORF Transcript_18404/g.52848 Transcript_18404/m.52848 type:complete len:265 (+) Transcript_18404:1054-1848(+)